MANFIWWNDDNQKPSAPSSDNSYSDAQARKLWEHEDNLINQRVTWLGITQGLLFTAYGATFQAAKDGVHAKEHLDLFLRVLAGAGIWLSIVVLVGVIGAVLAMFVIYRRSPWPHLGVTNATSVLGWICAAAMPCVFIFVWLNVAKTTLHKFLIDTVGSIWSLL